MMISFARAGPTSRTKRVVDATPSGTPRSTSGIQNSASAAAQRKSQARLSPQAPRRAQRTRPSRRLVRTADDSDAREGDPARRPPRADRARLLLGGRDRGGRSAPGAGSAARDFRRVSVAHDEPAVDLDRLAR